MRKIIEKKETCGKFGEIGEILGEIEERLGTCLFFLLKISKF
jgi:hypothetical protein